MVIVGLAAMLLLILKGRQPVTSAGLTALSISAGSSVPVSISGDVAHPGVYMVSDNLLTDSVINMSGPRCGQQSLLYHEQTSIPVKPGTVVRIVCNSPDNRLIVNQGIMKPSQLLTLGWAVDLNQVTESDLELLPGIGPTLAHRIVEYRQKNGDFKAKSELLQVEGIGEKKYKMLSAYFK